MSPNDLPPEEQPRPELLLAQRTWLEAVASFWTPRRIFWGFLGLSLALQALIYTGVTGKPVIRSDGVGYHAYLPAVLLDHDLSFAKFRQREFPKGIPYWTGIHHGPRAYVIKYPLGVALLQSPFFLAAAVVAKAGGYGSVYSTPYQVAAAVAAATYFGLGCAAVWRLLRRQFPPTASFPALLLTVFGTNLLHYATYDATFSHVYSFFLVATLLECGTGMFGASRARWAAFGLLAGLTVVTRPTNGVFVFFAIQAWVWESGTGTESFRRLRRDGFGLALALLVAAAPVALQFLYWRIATGHWFYYTYVNEGFNFWGPAGWRVLCGFEKGWLVYAPLVGLAAWGWFTARRQLLPDARFVLGFFVVNVWIISSWHDWGYGGAFSMRPLVESPTRGPRSGGLVVAGMAEVAGPAALPDAGLRLRRLYHDSHGGLLDAFVALYPSDAARHLAQPDIYLAARVKLRRAAPGSDLIENAKRPPYASIHVPRPDPVIAPIQSRVSAPAVSPPPRSRPESNPVSPCTHPERSPSSLSSRHLHSRCARPRTTGRCRPAIRPNSAFPRRGSTSPTKPWTAMSMKAGTRATSRSSRAMARSSTGTRTAGAISRQKSRWRRTPLSGCTRTRRSSRPSPS